MEVEYPRPVRLGAALGFSGIRKPHLDRRFHRWLILRRIRRNDAGRVRKPTQPPENLEPELSSLRNQVKFDFVEELKVRIFRAGVKPSRFDLVRNCLNNIRPFDEIVANI